MATRRSRPSAEPSAEDQALFEREAGVTRKLSRDGRERVPNVARPGPQGLPAEARSAKVGRDDDTPTLDSYAAPGVDRRELRKLKRGDYPPDLRLDLHGLMATEAVKRVTRILDRVSPNRPRCLCIVHGRGLHSPGNVPVLRSRVREVLREHPAVLAFSDAPKGDGGPGAVYVLLRR
jgi:DNA-nicking Smr family endonuclease